MIPVTLTTERLVLDQPTLADVTLANAFERMGFLARR